jgi:nucleoside-diphosphate-sugar epimerase
MPDGALVLVTGSAGRIGQAVVKELLARGQQVRGFDLLPTPQLHDSVVGDLTDVQALRQAAAGAGTIIHLAATPDDDDFLSQLLPNNIVGLYHVLEAARQSSAQRLILASSGQVNWWQRERGPWPIRVTDPPTPRYWYAAAKLFLEGAGQVYTENHGLSVIVARLGWCPRNAEHVRELAATSWGPDVYLSPGDAGRFFACAALASANIRHAVVYATSRPVGRLTYDLGPAKELLGFEPQDQWPEGSAECAKRRGE